MDAAARARRRRLAVDPMEALFVRATSLGGIDRDFVCGSRIPTIPAEMRLLWPEHFRDRVFRQKPKGTRPATRGVAARLDTPIRRQSRRR